MSNSEFNPRVVGVPVSLIRRFNSMKTDQTIDLGLGQLPYDPPASLRQAGADSFLNDSLGYSGTVGYEPLRQLIADENNVRNGTSHTIENVAITLGAEHAIFASLLVHLKGGDTVLLPEIGFVAYENIVKLHGGTVEYYKLNEDFEPDHEDIAAKLVASPKVLILNSPANPTGSVMSKDCAKYIAASLSQNGSKTWVISDEVYSKLIFTGQEHVSIAGMYDKTLVVSSVSKSAAAAGIRVGWVVANEELIEQVFKVIQYSVTSNSLAAQKAAAAYLSDASITEEYREMLQSNRDVIVNELKETALSSVAPNGSFYYFADISQFGDSETVATRLLKNQDVLTIPGVAFGQAGDRYIRISFAVDPEQLHEALRRIKTEFEL